mmetsp:Transcript_11854/g.31998  ORF Transcript_11854/g.31998 Transcript_11854/m.31998 type:complete len:213 (-) Transcript_11854:54-692(-)
MTPRAMLTMIRAAPLTIAIPLVVGVTPAPVAASSTVGSTFAKSAASSSFGASPEEPTEASVLDPFRRGCTAPRRQSVLRAWTPRERRCLECLVARSWRRSHQMGMCSRNVSRRHRRHLERHRARTCTKQDSTNGALCLGATSLKCSAKSRSGTGGLRSGGATSRRQRASCSASRCKGASVRIGRTLAAESPAKRRVRALPIPMKARWQKRAS